MVEKQGGITQRFSSSGRSPPKSGRPLSWWWICPCWTPAGVTIWPGHWLRALYSGCSR